MKKLIFTCLCILTVVTTLATACTSTIAPNTTVPSDNPSPESVPDTTVPSDTPVSDPEPTASDPEPIAPPQTTEPTPSPEPEAPGIPSATNDFSDAGLPDEAVVFPDAQWNDLGYIKVRAIAYVNSEVDPAKLPDDWPEANKFFGLFFQVECVELIEEYTRVSSSEFGFAGEGVQSVSLNVNPSGDVRSSWNPTAPGEIGYVYTLVTAEKLEDITKGWYGYSLKNEETGAYDKYIHYITSMPFSKLTVNEKPTDFNYDIPPSAVVSIGAWSEAAADPTVKVRTLAYDDYPLRDSEKPDFMYPEETMFFVYFEAENTGTEALNYVSVYTSFSGTGVKDSITLFSHVGHTTYGTTIEKLEPGETGVYYKVIAAKSMSDVQTITITLDKISIPLVF